MNLIDEQTKNAAQRLYDDSRCGTAQECVDALEIAEKIVRGAIRNDNIPHAACPWLSDSAHFAWAARKGICRTRGLPLGDKFLKGGDRE